MFNRLILAALCVVLFTVNANARPRMPNPAYAACVPTGDVMRPCAYQPNFMAGVRSIRVTMKRDQATPAARPSRRSAKAAHRVVSRYGAPEPSLTWTATTLVDRARTYVAPQIVAHPSGCPARLFCGCGAAVRVFGRPVRDLWLAANWLRFPRAAPAPGMVAARRGHVFVLESHLGGSTWLAYDANSGRRQTRIHARSIAGFAIVNPHGAA